MRKLVMDIAVNSTFLGGDKEDNLYLSQLFSEEALRDLVCIVWRPSWKKWTIEESKALDVCGRYHVHEEGVRCTSTKKRKREDEAEDD